MSSSSFRFFSLVLRTTWFCFVLFRDPSCDDSVGKELPFRMVACTEIFLNHGFFCRRERGVLWVGSDRGVSESESESESESVCV